MLILHLWIQKIRFPRAPILEVKLYTKHKFIFGTIEIETEEKKDFYLYQKVVYHPNFSNLNECLSGKKNNEIDSFILLNK